jgi:hypothetical protein
MPVALGQPLGRALVGCGADHAGELGLDKGLVDGLGGLTDAVIDLRDLECIQNLQQCRLVKGHRALCPFASTISRGLADHRTVAASTRATTSPRPATYTTRWDATRYEEEWLAELDAMPDGGLATLAFAFFIRIRIGSMERRLGLLTSHSRPDDESDANGQNLELLQETTHIKVKNRSDLTVDNLVILSREANWKLSHPRSKLLGGNPGISLPSRRRHKKRRRPS